jgi:hypothetical protein
MQPARRESESWNVETVCSPIAAPAARRPSSSTDNDPEGVAETVQIGAKDFREIAAMARQISRERAAPRDKEAPPSVPPPAQTERMFVSPRGAVAASSPRPGASVAPPAPMGPASRVAPMAPMAAGAPATPAEPAAPAMSAVQLLTTDLPPPIKMPSVAFRPIWIVMAIVLAIACLRIIPAAISHVSSVTNELDPSQR